MDARFQRTTDSQQKRNPLVSSIYSRSRGSPLRDGTSPKQKLSNTVTFNNTFVTDESAVIKEIRRGQELLKQIKSKENQLASRIYQSSQQHSRHPPFDAGQYLQETPNNQKSFMQQQQQQFSGQSQNSQTSSVGFLREVSVQENQLKYINKERSSPLREKLQQTQTFNQKFQTYEQVNQTQQVRFADDLHNVNLPQTQQEIFIKKLQNDNETLSKRLQIVVAELDRVLTEKERVQQTFSTIQDQTKECQLEIQLIEQEDQGLLQGQEQLEAQRQNNKVLRQTISQAERHRLDTVKQLRVAQNQRERSVADCEDLAADFDHRMAIIKEIEQNKHHLVQKIADNQNQVQIVQSQLIDDERQNYEQQIIIDVLTEERNNLMYKLQELSRTYEKIVSDLVQERIQVDAHERRQKHIIAAKKMFTTMEAMVYARKQMVLNEFFFYCRFDERCHRTLKTFSLVLQKVGTNKQIHAIKLWYQNVFKPISVLSQTQTAIQKRANDNLKQLVFANWRSAFLSLGQDKNKIRLGLQKVVSIKRKNEKKDKTRMLMNWRDYQRLKNQQERVLNSVLLRTSNRLLRKGLFQWNKFYLDRKDLIQTHILSTQLSQKRQQSLILSSFKDVVTQKKQIRLKKLALTLKAWKCWLARRNYFKVQAKKLATLKFALRDRLLGGCFQQLRLEKESQKVSLMQETWTDRVQPDIFLLLEDIRQISTTELKQKKLRGLHCLSRACRGHLQSYFEHWKRYNAHVNQNFDRNLRAIITRKYRNTLQQAMAKFRNSKQWHKNGFQRVVIGQEQDTELDLQNTIISLTNQVTDEQLKLSYQQRLMLQHSIHIFNTRTLRRGLTQWHDRCRHLGTLQNAAKTLSNRMQSATKRSCWNHYKQQMLLCRKEDHDEATIEKRKLLRLFRIKSKIFNAIKGFVEIFRDQQTYWKITLTNLEVCLKRKGMRRWIDQANSKQEQQFKQMQNTNTYRFDEINSDLGQAAGIRQSYTDNNTDLFIQLRDQGQRILANTFARCYYTQIGNRFRKWFDVTKFIQQREQIIKRTIQHKIKAEFFILSAAWKNWIAKTRIEEVKASIIYTSLKNQEKQQLIIFNQEEHNLAKTDLEQLTTIEENERQQDSNHTEIAIHIATAKAQNNYYQSKLRFIFQQWVEFYRRQKHFTQTVTRVISKSLWQNGFDQIGAEYKSNLKFELQTNHLISMKRLFKQKNVERVIQMWKDQIRSKAHIIIDETKKSTDTICNLFNSKVNEIKLNSQNKSQSLHRISIYKQTIRAWQTVVQWQQNKRKAVKVLHESQQTEIVKKALRLWHSRQEVTRVSHQKVAKYRQKQRTVCITAVLKALRLRCEIVKKFNNKLVLVFHKFDTICQQTAFQQIQIFAQTKKKVHYNQKVYSALTLSKLLHALHIRCSSLYFTQLQNSDYHLKSQEAKLKSLINNLRTKHFRSQFMRWRDNTHYLATEEDVNLQGPIVEEVLDAQTDFTNTLKFMTNQGYTILQIQQTTDFTTQRQKELLSRSVARFKHYTEMGDLYLKPKMFDRWRMYIKIKKLVRYHLRIIENKLAPVRADLQIAFARWKAKNENSIRTLNGLERQQLITRCVANDDELRWKDQTGQQKELQIVQMNFERDELIDNYVRGQKLGIAVSRDNIQRAMAKSLRNLSDNAQRQRRQHIEQVLQRNIQLIAGLKDKITHIEFDNNNLAGDNEELRQFSLDGFEIARNASLLGDERERLSIDLADKAKTIKRLLDEHDNLERLLIQQQYKTESLIQNTLNQRKSSPLRS